ncbi:hypothetical protein EYF80_013552 [Liparis tanakae]|uniref:Uncharacterized protein n=1 Tax=Liparis tanakae TaxID=230148 RepID=A0A4Z2IFS0_9TELE|nr:hypothetical protein EYF80_013552 [Liparis tanakae]
MGVPPQYDANRDSDGPSMGGDVGDEGVVGHPGVLCGRQSGDGGVRACDERWQLGKTLQRGERGLMGDGPLSGEGETCRLGDDSSALGEKLWMGEGSSRRGVRLRLGEQLLLPGEKALGDALHARLENSALLLPGEAARLSSHAPLGESSAPGLRPGPGGSGSGVPC